MGGCVKGMSVCYTHSRDSLLLICESPELVNPSSSTAKNRRRKEGNSNTPSLEIILETEQSTKSLYLCIGPYQPPSLTVGGLHSPLKRALLQKKQSYQKMIFVTSDGGRVWAMEAIKMCIGSSYIYRLCVQHLT